MNSRRTASFRRRYDRLPDAAQEQAITAYDLFASDPHDGTSIMRRLAARQ